MTRRVIMLSQLLDVAAVEAEAELGNKLYNIHTKNLSFHMSAKTHHRAKYTSDNTIVCGIKQAMNDIQCFYHL